MYLRNRKKLNTVLIPVDINISSTGLSTICTYHHLTVPSFWQLYPKETFSGGPLGHVDYRCTNDDVMGALSNQPFGVETFKQHRTDYTTAGADEWSCFIA